MNIHNLHGSSSSVLETSSGILEVLQTLEQEDEREKLQQYQKTQSHQDISKIKKDESKRSVFKSLLKRTHSAPKKINITKAAGRAATEREKELEKPSGREEQQELLDEPPQSPTSPHYSSCCHPFVDKLKVMADKQLHKSSHKNKPTIKKIPLEGKNKIVLREETKIIKLKDSPKSERKEFASYVEKRDSDEILEIIDLEESPSEVRKRREEERRQERSQESSQERTQEKSQEREQPSSIVIPDEVIELPPAPKPKPSILTIKKSTLEEEDDEGKEPTVEELLEEEFKNDSRPKKAPRRQKEHVYEDIDNPDDLPAPQTVPIIPSAPMINATADTKKDKGTDFLKNIFDGDDSLKLSLSKQDDAVVNELNEKEIKSLNEAGKVEEITPTESTLQAPISTVEFITSTSLASADEKRARLSAVSEESEHSSEVKNDTELIAKLCAEPEIKSVLKLDSSPAPDNKKVTFSPSTEGCTDDEDYDGGSGSQREDVKLPDHIKLDSRWSKMRSAYFIYYYFIYTCFQCLFSFL